MKIALYHNLTSGGSKREAHEYATQFLHAGHTVHLFQPSTANQDFLPLEQATQRQSQYEVDLVRELNLRLPGVRKYLGLGGLLINLRRLDQLARRVAADIDAGGYDLVLVHHDQIVQSPYLLRYLKTPSAYYCAEPMREFYEPSIPRPYARPRSRLSQMQWTWYGLERRLRATIIKREDQRNVQATSILITNSFFSAESIYRAYGLRARVSYLGVDTDKFRPLGLERQNFVLSVGAVVPHKGYDFLIAAIAQIAPTDRPRLVIVGNTASRGEVQYLERLAAERDVSLQFCVNLSDDQLVTLYNQARALVYAPVLEPFGFAPLEAMACGTPVVAVKEGGVRESVIDGLTGRLVDREPAAFAQALSEVLSNPVGAPSMGMNGRETVLRQWTWPQAYARLLANLQAPFP